MKVFYLLFGCFCLNWRTDVATAFNKTKKLGPAQGLLDLTTSTTTLAPSVATTSAMAVPDNVTVNINGVNNNNTSIYDQKHKILLVVLSDVNVRNVKDPQQASNVGQPSASDNDAENKSIINKSNETLLIDATMLKEILKKLQPNNKCVNIVPHYVPPTFPWIIRKEQRKPIAYIQPILCEDVDDEGVVLTGSSTLPKNQKLVLTNNGFSQTRSSKNKRKRQRSKTRRGSAKKSSRLPFSLSHIRDLDHDHESDFDNAWSDFSSEEN